MYRTRLSASIDCIRFLLRQGLTFRGHDEFETSNNQDNFLELLKFLAEHNESISNVVLQNAPKNHQLIAPDMLNEIGDDLFAIIVDESRDISNKEQMAVALRFVDKKGRVLERFLAIVHVSDTSAISLKVAIESLLCKHGLSLSRIRGQGYDGASNMQGALNGLKSLILRENSSTFYIHCFAHQLQLTLVAVSKNEIQVASLFNLVSILLNIVGGSCRRVDMLREKQLAKVKDGLTKGELKSGCGLNQETCLKRPNDTRWSSHYNTLINVTIMYSSIIDVLEIIMEDGLSSVQCAEAKGLLESVQTFDFVFTLHLMKNILGITNELSQALHRKDQDIINAMTLVRISKQRLQIMRDNGWEFLLDEVSTFCKTNEIDIPDMNAIFVAKGRRRREIQQVLNIDKYRAGLFYVVLDRQLRELDHRFNEINTELLLCMACLSPDDSFSAFDKQRLIHLAQFYPSEFSAMELIVLENQLETYIIDKRTSDEFSIIRGIAALAEKLVESKRNIVYPLVYLFVKLALILLVATATVERAFSAMKIVKNRLRNRMGDGWINDCLVTYIEKDIFDTIDNELIIQRFQLMKTRRGQL